MRELEQTCHPDGTLLEQAIIMGVPASNNEVEYEAITLENWPSTQTLIEHLDWPSIEEIKQVDSMQIDEDPSWQDPIVDYLENRNMPKDKSKTRKVQQKAVRYYMQDNKLNL
ncbi:hypothetical protein L3X38_000356 [Prunus dulcis]|uniref:Uncharacterized protein n=1 Tax=Prunus dulcis TaxID=3755 RepID=A0AAD4USG9_PRUDU|nr:hypothetical protein L3X38_000356 [Prunus dulcis]